MSFEAQHRLLMLAALGVAVALAAGWVWLCAGVRKVGWRGTAGTVALQLSVVTMIYTAIRGATLHDALLSGLMPLVFPMIELERFLHFQEFLSPIYPFVFGGLVLASSPFLLRPRLFRWSIVPVFLVTIVTGVIVGERMSQSAMCREAVAEGIVQFRRHSLLWSLANTPEEFQFEIHAAAEKAGQRLGWSYREMGWYTIPPEAWGEVEEPPFVCNQ